MNFLNAGERESFILKTFTETVARHPDTKMVRLLLSIGHVLVVHKDASRGVELVMADQAGPNCYDLDKIQVDSDVVLDLHSDGDLVSKFHTDAVTIYSLRG